MEWMLFWTIAAQVAIGAVVLLFVALVISLIIHMIRGEETQQREILPSEINSPLWTQTRPESILDQERARNNG